MTTLTPQRFFLTENIQKKKIVFSWNEREAGKGINQSPVEDSKDIGTQSV